MNIFHISEKHTRTMAIGASILFLCTGIVYFTPLTIPHKVAIPVGTLAMASMWICPWQITLALLFSAAGDYYGSCNEFLAQMGCFGASHILFIAYFAIRYHRKVEHDRKLTARAKGFMAMIIFCTAALLGIAFTTIVPAAPAGVVRIGTIVYTLLICGMLALAMLQRSSVFALGAVLFVFSDFILSWHMFIEPVPHSNLLIMITYYIAQWLLFIRSSRFRLAHPLRLLRF